MSIWGIPRQIDQAEAITFFSFKYVIDGHEKRPASIKR